MKKVFSKISQNSQESTCARVSFLIKLQTSGNFIKWEALAQVFSYEFCEIFKNTFLKEHLQRLLFVNMLSLGLSAVTSNVSVADFKHVFVLLGKAWITINVLQILEIPYPANKYSKSTTETLKQDVKSAKS